MSSDSQKLAALTVLPIEEQAKAFLRRYVLDFNGKFEEVLNQTVTFKKYLKKSDDTELDEFEAHLFLEKEG